MPIVYEWWSLKELFAFRSIYTFVYKIRKMVSFELGKEEEKYVFFVLSQARVKKKSSDLQILHSIALPQSHRDYGGQGPLGRLYTWHASCILLGSAMSLVSCFVRRHVLSQNVKNKTVQSCPYTHTSNLKIYFKFLFSQPTLYLHVQTDSCGPMAATVQLYSLSDQNWESSPLKSHGKGKNLMRISRWTYTINC